MTSPTTCKGTPTCSCSVTDPNPNPNTNPNPNPNPNQAAEGISNAFQLNSLPPRIAEDVKAN